MLNRLVMVICGQDDVLCKYWYIEILHKRMVEFRKSKPSMNKDIVPQWCKFFHWGARVFKQVSYSAIGPSLIRKYYIELHSRPR